MYSLSLSLIVLRLEINWYLVCNKCCKYLALNRYTQSRVHDTSYLIPVPHCASSSSTPLNGRFLLKDVPGCCISRSGRRNLRSMIRMCRLDTRWSVLPEKKHYAGRPIHVEEDTHTQSHLLKNFHHAWNGSWTNRDYIIIAESYVPFESYIIPGCWNIAVFDAAHLAMIAYSNIFHRFYPFLHLFLVGRKAALLVCGALT